MKEQEQPPEYVMVDRDTWMTMFEYQLAAWVHGLNQLQEQAIVCQQNIQALIGLRERATRLETEGIIIKFLTNPEQSELFIRPVVKGRTGFVLPHETEQEEPEPEATSEEDGLTKEQKLAIQEIQDARVMVQNAKPEELAKKGFNKEELLADLTRQWNEITGRDGHEGE